MKTLKIVDEEINGIIEQIDAVRKDPELKGERSLTSRLEIMRRARKYLEFNPKIESVNRQKLEVERYLQISEERFQKWLNDPEFPKRVKIVKAKEVYNEQNDIDLKEIKRWKDELKFINYLLSN